MTRGQNIELANGYTLKTTFFEDFMIAEKFGVDAVKDTFKRAFNEWKDNYIYVTELTIVTNLLCWHWYYLGKEEISKLYSDYYHKTRSYALNHLKGDEFQYFWKWTD